MRINIIKTLFFLILASGLITGSILVARGVGNIKVAGCGPGYIRVPGNATFGTSDFCVMQYEAKNVGGVAVSQADTTPWVSITQTAAITACTAAGGHLITNNEWMTIARNIEQVASNWSGGSVGSGGIFRGNNGLDDDLGYDGDDPEFGTGRNTKARLTLSNGEQIWDLSGNVWEWTDDTCTQDLWYNSGAYIEWTNANLADYEKPNAGPAGAYTATQGVGRYYGCTANGNAFVRGGGWADTSTTGAFALLLFLAPASSSYTSLGFRCVRPLFDTTATVQPLPVIKMNPILGHDLDLDAKYYAQAANNTIHNITTEDISISAWVKVDTDASSIGVALGKRSTTGYMLYYSDIQKISAYARDSDTAYSITGNSSIKDNKWHHIALILDRDNEANSKVYLDGIDNTSSKNNSILDVSTVTNAVTMALGAQGNSGDYKFDGQLRDVKLYYADGDHWTDEQILYQATHPFDYSAGAGTLTDYWRCDEGTGTTINGKPSTGYNLTLSNALAWSTQPKIKMTTGLVGYWKMDDNADNTTVRDYSGKGNNGTFSDATGNPFTSAHATSGQISGALSFDGTDDYVNAGNGSSLDVRKAFTFSAWVMNKANNTNNAIVGNYSGNGFGYRNFSLNFNSANIAITIGDGSGVNYQVAQSSVFTASTLNEWHYITGTYDGGTLKLYVDGIFRSGPASTVTPTYTASANFIGKTSSAYYFNGLIDDVRIYNYARTAEQIKQDYERGLAGKP